MDEELKVGDYAEVIGKFGSPSHAFRIGDIVKVTAAPTVSTNSFHCRCLTGSLKDIDQWVNPRDLDRNSFNAIVYSILHG